MQQNARNFAKCCFSCKHLKRTLFKTQKKRILRNQRKALISLTDIITKDFKMVTYILCATKKNARKERLIIDGTGVGR